MVDELLVVVAGVVVFVVGTVVVVFVVVVVGVTGGVTTGATTVIVALSGETFRRLLVDISPNRMPSTEIEPVCATLTVNVPIEKFPANGSLVYNTTDPMPWSSPCHFDPLVNAPYVMPVPTRITASTVLTEPLVDDPARVHVTVEPAVVVVGHDKLAACPANADVFGAIINVADIMVAAMIINIFFFIIIPFILFAYVYYSAVILPRTYWYNFATSRMSSVPLLATSPAIS